MSTDSNSSNIPINCPLCKKPSAPLGENRAFPFCSKRCKMEDLGHWFNEEYRVPGRAAPAERAPSPDVDPDDDGEWSDWD